MSLGFSKQANVILDQQCDLEISVQKTDVDGMQRDTVYGIQDCNWRQNNRS